MSIRYFHVSNVINLLCYSHCHAKCVGPSLPLLSTWVSIDVQEAFYNAFHAEQACQTGLTTYSLHHNGDYVYQHNIRL